ncbi:MAG: hypothetical protein H0U10_03480 [Chloroflexia bacterium]|nr:hypothetical protein [Chloroflexia bacterium]
MAAAHPVRDHIPVLEEDEWFPEVERLTVEEGRAFFDEKVKTALGISGDEFLRRYDAGVYDAIEEDEAGRRIIRLMMAIPFARSTPIDG